MKNIPYNPRMNRDIYQQLKHWKASSRRKPLIINGARQVGKTYALKHFGSKEYQRVAYFNFEKDKQLASYFQASIEPKQLIKTLTIHSDVDIEPENTLLIFDEIQECPRALNSLKYFCEEANDYHIAAAGSLLGVKTANSEGFPVGKVNFLNLYPFSFFEFLVATGNERLRLYLEEITEFEPIPNGLHEKLIELLKYYFFIGGMPEVLAEYIRFENLEAVREVQLEILEAYEKDFAKHAPHNQIMKITTVWQQVHQELAKENKKFIFSNIRKSARGRDYEQAIQWLTDAGLIYKSHQISAPRLPLSSCASTTIFKIFAHDVGLLGAKSNLSAKTIINGNSLFIEFNGALTENYVAQQLVSSRRPGLYYWTSQGSAEVDFVIETEQNIYPLEVKAGISTKKKSLLVYGDRYPQSLLSRSTGMNLKCDGKIHNYPLYLIERFPLKDLTPDNAGMP